MGKVARAARTKVAKAGRVARVARERVEREVAVASAILVAGPGILLGIAQTLEVPQGGPFVGGRGPICEAGWEARFVRFVKAISRSLQA